MSEIQFVPGKFYRTRDGRKARCLYVELSLPEANQVGMVDDGFLRSYYISGKYYDYRESELDIISEWHEPVSVDVWVVVRFENGNADAVDVRFKEQCAHDLCAFWKLRGYRTIVQKVTITEKPQ